jgi:hypothetical protein
VRRLRVSRSTVIWLGVFVVVAWLITRADLVPLLLAAVVVGVLFKIGLAMLGGLAQPVPEPPLPVQHLRHRGAHDHGQRRDARAPAALPRGHGPRHPRRRPLNPQRAFHSLWTRLWGITLV